LNSSRELIIIVDDDTTSLTVGKSALSAKYDVLTTSSAPKLFSLLEKLTPDLILLDIRMPGMDGYETIAKLKKSTATDNIPVIFLTSHTDPADENKWLDWGAADYIIKPFSRELLLKRVDLHILLDKQRRELLMHDASLQTEVCQKTRNDVVELQNTILRTVAALAECRGNITGVRIGRTERYLRLLIDYLLINSVYTDEIKSWDIDLIVMSSQLHDVGKLSIKDSILMKPGALSEDEFDEMKTHAQSGVEIIRKIDKGSSESTFLQYAEIMAGTHHERWDGSGYPNGLAGEEIPLPGRLMSIIDVYSALTNERPYKNAFTHDQAVEIIKEGRGTLFDPVICDVFVKHESVFVNVDKAGPPVSDAQSKLTPTITAVTDEMGTRSGKVPGYVTRMGLYLEILFDALLCNESYGHTVSSWDKELFLISAQLHDIGNIAVADHILRKPDKLSASEFADIEAHVDYGLKIIGELKDSVEDGSMLCHAEMMVGNHHEKWDGSGYPRGVKGNEIPLQGRIMSIVDVYDALTTDRPHRGRISHDDAVKTITAGSGIQFDPELVEVFVHCKDEFEHVKQGKRAFQKNLR